MLWLTADTSGFFGLSFDTGRTSSIVSRVEVFFPVCFDSLLLFDRNDATDVMSDTFESFRPMVGVDLDVTIFGGLDVVAPDGWKPIVERIPGAQGQPHEILAGGGHFLQEDLPEQYTEALIAWLSGLPER